jgi:hypothetical protein
MSYAETELAAGRTQEDQALNGAEYGKWASDFAHAYYALVKGEADLGELMEWAYEIWPQRMSESPVEVAGEWFRAIPAETRARYLPGGEAYRAYAQWQASLSD